MIKKYTDLQTDFDNLITTKNLNDASKDIIIKAYSKMIGEIQKYDDNLKENTTELELINKLNNLYKKIKTIEVDSLKKEIIEFKFNNTINNTDYKAKQKIELLNKEIKNLLFVKKNILVKYNNKINNLEKNINNLYKFNNTNSNQNDKLLSELNKVKTLLQEKNIEIDLNQITLNALRMDLDMCASKSDDLKDDIKKLRKNMGSTELILEETQEDLEQKNLEIQQKNFQLRQKNLLISEKEGEIKQKNEKLAEVDSIIASKDAVIATKNQKILELEDELFTTVAGLIALIELDDA